MKRIVLAGGGHAHLAVLHHLSKYPIPDSEVILVTPEAFQWYSGMLPGLIAGHYQPHECRIDLRPLAQRAGVTLLLDTVIGINADRQYVCLPDGTHLNYDLLSLDIGSSTDTSWLAVSKQPVLPIKPLDRFTQLWEKARKNRSEGIHFAVIGAGAAGVELVFAIGQYLRSNDSSNKTVSLVGTPSGLLPGFSKGVIKRIQHQLDEQHIQFHPHRAVATEEGLLLSSGTTIDADYVLAATGAVAHEWLQLSMLTLDSAGFVSVNAYHQSLSHSNVFAVGDVCSREDGTVDRSGVHAVHAGPIIAHNIGAALQGYPLKTYDAKRRSLYLLSCGKRYGVMSWGNLSVSGSWVWRWKNYIDTQFIQRNAYAK